MPVTSNPQKTADCKNFQSVTPYLCSRGLLSTNLRLVPRLRLFSPKQQLTSVCNFKSTKPGLERVKPVIFLNQIAQKSLKWCIRKNTPEYTANRTNFHIFLLLSVPMGEKHFDSFLPPLVLAGFLKVQPKI